jgi:hypothetical protein
MPNHGHLHDLLQNSDAARLRATWRPERRADKVLERFRMIRKYGNLQNSAQHPPKLAQVLHVGRCPAAWHAGVFFLLNDRLLACASKLEPKEMCRWRPGHNPTALDTQRLCKIAHCRATGRENVAFVDDDAFPAKLEQRRYARVPSADTRAPRYARVGARRAGA